MIYDCFTFFNELDLLEIRLNILNDYVDKFVIVEATRTQNNKEKILYYDKNKERFAKFNDKIVHIVVDSFPASLEQWTIENYQRNKIMQGLSGCKDNDVIIISDLDEIPNPKYIKKYKHTKRIIGFQLNTFNYYLNNYSVGQHHETRFPKMLSYKNLKSILNDVKIIDTYDKKVNIGTTPTLVRIYKGKLQKTILNAGWHFSYIGGLEVVKEKFTSSCEGVNIFTKEQYEKRSQEKLFNNQFDLIPVYIDGSFPKYIRDNTEKYSNLIKREKLIKIDSINKSNKLNLNVKKFFVFVIRCFTCLIPSKTLRHEFNEKAKKIQFNKKRKNVKKMLEEQKQYLHLKKINQQLDSTMKILHVSTYNIECGIAEFTQNYIQSLSEIGYQYNSILSFRYDYLEDIELFKNYMDEIIKQSDDFDLVSIQHEYSFWNLQDIPSKKCFDDNLYKKYKSNSLSYSLILLDYLIAKLLRRNKHINIIWHTDFKYILNLLNDLKIINENTKYSEMPFFRFFNSNNLQIIIMNDKMIESLKEYKIPSINVNRLQHPVKKTTSFKICDVTYIKEKYNINDDDIIIGTFGFINKLKGIENIINALKYLPDNYKYIHFGGVNPNDKSNYIFDLENHINKNMLVSRVIITGFIKNEEVDASMGLLNLGLYVGSANNNYASGAINNLLANKIPLLTTDIAQFAKIKSGYNCLEICDNPTDPQNLANNILEIINNNSKIEEFKANCEKYITEHSFVNFAKKTMAKYE